jgi:hypothetical protein
VTLTATYNDDLARIQLAVTGAPAAADYALFERSTDQITWTQVRGGQTVGLTSGACTLNDFEFAAGVTNYYRVSYVDTADVQRIGAGAFATGNNVTLNPAIPAGVSAGDMLVLSVSHRNTSATITTPTGWTRVLNGASHMATFYRSYQVGDAAPSVAFSGGAAGDSCSAIITAWSNANPPTHVALQTNASAQNVATPGGATAGTRVVWLMHEWKQSTGTGASLPTVQFEADPTGGFNTAGANAESQIMWRTLASTDARTILASTTTWTGGVAAVSKARLMYLDRRSFVSQETASTTPAMVDVWLKNVLRPNLNRKVDPVQRIQVARKSRSGSFDIVGRTMPIAVTDVRGGREFNLTLFVEDYTERDELDNTLGTGDVMYLHIPPGKPTSSAYVLVGDTSWSDETGLYALPLTEVAAPDGTLVGDTILWVDVIAEYATWADVIADEPTWSDLLSQIAPGDTVIVP